MHGLEEGRGVVEGGAEELEHEGKEERSRLRVKQKNRPSSSSGQKNTNVCIRLLEYKFCNVALILSVQHCKIYIPKDIVALNICANVYFVMMAPLQ